MEKMTALMKDMMKDVADSHDIAALGGRVKEVESTIKGLGDEVNTIESNMTRIRAEIEALKKGAPPPWTKCAATRAGKKNFGGLILYLIFLGCATSRCEFTSKWLEPALDPLQGLVPLQRRRINENREGAGATEALWQRMPQEARDRLR